MIELTAQEKIFVDEHLAGKSIYEAAALAYPDANPKSKRTLATQIIAKPKIQEYLVMRRGVDGVFTREYLLMRLKAIIDDKEAIASARVAAIKVAGEITGHIQHAAAKGRPKSKAEEDGVTPELKSLTAAAAQYIGQEAPKN